MKKLAFFRTHAALLLTAAASSAQASAAGNASRGQNWLAQFWDWLLQLLQTAFGNDYGNSGSFPGDAISVSEAHGLSLLVLAIVAGLLIRAVSKRRNG